MLGLKRLSGALTSLCFFGICNLCDNGAVHTVGKRFYARSTRKGGHALKDAAYPPSASKHHRSSLGYRPPTLETMLPPASGLAYATLLPD